jgi:uncharacterized protein YndB with AHSA1/START domain
MNQHTVVLTRVFDAPRERVFACWTHAEHLQHWFGPKGFTIHSCETDPRPGGELKLCMRAPDGEEHWVRGRFRQMDFPNRLSFTESDGKTTVALNATARGPSDEAAAMLKGMDKGWAQTVERLGAHLKRR